MNTTNTKKDADAAGFPSALLEGYESFSKGRLPRDRGRYEELAENGQKPHTMVIGCCDSRATPEAIFDADPGDIFIVRNVANLVPPHDPDGSYHGVTSALEFAVQALKVRHVVVMGHARCGGIAAFREQMTGQKSEPLSSGDYIGKWISQLKPLETRLECTGAETPEELQTKIERESIRQSVDNLRTFPYISDLLERGEISVHGAWFDISSGELWTLDEETGEFENAVS